MVRFTHRYMVFLPGEGGRATGEGPCGAQLNRRCGLLFRPVLGPVRSLLLSFGRLFPVHPCSQSHELSFKTFRLNVLTDFYGAFATYCFPVVYGDFRTEKVDNLDEFADMGNKSGGRIFRH